MPHMENCKAILRRLIAKGDPSLIPFAERAVNEYWDVTLEKARAACACSNLTFWSSEMRSSALSMISPKP